jgi:glycine hydroxymethyltransferase
MKAHGRDYASQIIRNAKALGKALAEGGVGVEAGEFGYTESHQVAVNVSKYMSGVEAAVALEKSDIIVNYNMLPGDTDPRNPSGLRIGTSEMTRFGMKEADFRELAALMAAVITKGKNVRDEVHKLRARFMELKYC